MLIPFFAAIECVNGADSFVMHGDEASVRFDASQEGAAREVLRLYPNVRMDLNSVIPWPVDFSPTFILLKRGEVEKIAESRLVTALAVPERNLVLLDLSKMSTHAFVLESTMKHELCHLLLHRHINDSDLPKWLDEGICQWVSKGATEIVMERKASSLDEAVLAGRLLPLWELTSRFPQEDRLLMLAYEQSESLVAYVVKTHGAGQLILLLNHLRDGKTFPEAVQGSLGITLTELESNWQRSLKKNQTWFLYVSMHIYEILFFAAALLTVVGFMRLVFRRMALRNRSAGQNDHDDQDL